MEHTAFKERIIAVQNLRAEGKYEQTIEQGEVLIEDALAAKDYNAILTGYVTVGAAYYCTGYIEKAFEYLLKHQALCETHGNHRHQLNGTNMRFLLHECTGAYEQAKEALEQGIRLGILLEQYNMVSNAYSNYSHILLLEGDYENALCYALKGLEMAGRHRPYTPILEVRVRLNVVKAYCGLGRFEEAKVVIEAIQAAGLFDAFPREYGQFNSVKGHWYLKQRCYKEAFEWYTKAEEIVASYHDSYLLKEIEQARCLICEYLGDFNQGFKIQKHYIQLIQEIHEREIKQKAMRYELSRETRRFKKEARTDYLTGITNRHGLREKTKRWQKKWDEKPAEVACVVLDVDTFKSVNDTYGHLVGDQVIKAVVGCVQTKLRERDLFVRYGGDEFVIVFQNQDRRCVMNKVEEIVHHVRQLEFVVEQGPFRVTLSVGIAWTQMNQDTTFEDLFYKADCALYEAKRRGKNQIYCDLAYCHDAHKSC
ncbi:MAG: diguanylate cyclase [Cellulosilyticaceae bacterium]